MAILVKSDLDLENSSKILNIPNPVSNLDAVNKDYVDTNITELSNGIALEYATKLDISNLTTSDIEEGSNLYYTDQRVRLNNLNDLSLPIIDVNFNSVKLINLADPINSQDATTKNYVITQLTDFADTFNTTINQLTTLDIPENNNLYYTDQRVRANKLNTLAAPDLNININNNRLINLADPVNSQDAVTKGYHESNSISLGLVIALG